MASSCRRAALCALKWRRCNANRRAAAAALARSCLAVFASASARSACARSCSSRRFRAASCARRAAATGPSELIRERRWRSRMCRAFLIVKLTRGFLHSAESRNSRSNPARCS